MGVLNVQRCKNITCASIIAFSVYFAGASFCSSGLTHLSQILYRFIFLGSLQTELLLDMRDYEGDLANSIQTVPVLFGLSKTHLIATAVLYANLFINVFHIMSTKEFRFGLYFLGICSPLFLDMEKIAECEYSKKSIILAVKKTMWPMILVTAYLCILS